MEENNNMRQSSASDNDSPPDPVPQYHPGIWWQPDYSDSQDDAGGYQHSVCMTLREAPTPILSCLHEGGTPAPTLRTRKDRGWT